MSSSFNFGKSITKKAICVVIVLLFELKKHFSWHFCLPHKYRTYIQAMQKQVKCAACQVSGVHRAGLWRNATWTIRTIFSLYNVHRNAMMGAALDCTGVRNGLCSNRSNAFNCGIYFPILIRQRHMVIQFFRMELKRDWRFMLYMSGIKKQVSSMKLQNSNEVSRVRWSHKITTLFSRVVCQIPNYNFNSTICKHKINWKFLLLLSL